MILFLKDLAFFFSSFLFFYEFLKLNCEICNNLKKFKINKKVDNLKLGKILYEDNQKITAPIIFNHRKENLNLFTSFKENAFLNAQKLIEFGRVICGRNNEYDNFVNYPTQYVTYTSKKK